MLNKIYATVDEAVNDVSDGSSILFGGFGKSGNPNTLIDAILRKGTQDIIAINNNAGEGDEGLASLFKYDRISKLTCSFPESQGSYIFKEKYLSGKVKLELVPQGTLAERIRAGGSGIMGFYTPTGYGTEIANGKETREINGVHCILEKPISADFAFIKARKADRWGNLVYYKSGRNFNPLMAMSGKVTIAEVDEIVELGELDPEEIITPGIFIQRVVKGGA